VVQRLGHAQQGRPAVTLAPPQEPPTRNVLPFNRKGPPHRFLPETRWSVRHIIICVNDSFPAGTVQALQAARPQDCFALIDAALDAGRGTPYLAIPSICENLESEFLVATGADNQVITFCISPTHAHVLIKDTGDFSLDATVERWKEGALNGWNGRRAPDERIWAPGYYDTSIRGARQIESVRMAIVVHEGRSPAGW